MSLKYKIAVFIAPTIFLFDQLTKYIIRSSMRIGEHISVIDGYFDIVHVTNKGAAFGMFSRTADAFRIPFFYTVSVVAVVVIVVTFVRMAADDKYLAVVFSLIVGGIAGNIFDRIRFGEVTDFLSVHFRYKLEWPAFNVADSAITVAMILLAWGILRPVKR